MPWFIDLGSVTPCGAASNVAFLSRILPCPVDPCSIRAQESAFGMNSRVPTMVFLKAMPWNLRVSQASGNLSAQDLTRTFHRLAPRMARRCGTTVEKLMLLALPTRGVALAEGVGQH